MSIGVDGGGRKPPTIYPNGLWVCPRCSNEVKFLVDMTSVPTCHKHVGGAVVLMEKKEK